MEYPHFANLIQTQASKLKDSNAIWFKNSNAKFWEVITWSEFASSVEALSNALFDLGITQDNKVAILAPNMPQSFIVDFAAFSVGAITVPLYASLTFSHAKFAIEDASVSMLFVGEQSQYDLACELISNIKVLKLIVVNNERVVLRPEVNSMYFLH